FDTLKKEIKMTGLMVSMLAFVAGVKNKLESEKGATAVEYGIMVALIAVAIIAAVTAFGTQLSAMFTTVAGKI
ncbi:MAG: Flp family type IVb pilin, partial [Pseudarthrobacter sp.]